jgi:hypothetical protein
VVSPVVSTVVAPVVPPVVGEWRAGLGEGREGIMILWVANRMDGNGSGACGGRLRKTSKEHLKRIKGKMIGAPSRYEQSRTRARMYASTRAANRAI